MERRLLPEMRAQARRQQVFPSCSPPGTRRGDSGQQVGREQPFAKKAEAARLHALHVCRMLGTSGHSRLDIFMRSAARSVQLSVPAVRLLDTRRRCFMSAPGGDFIESQCAGSC